MGKTRIDRVAGLAGEGACLLYLFASTLSVALQNLALAATALAAAAVLATRGSGGWRRLAPSGNLWTALAFAAVAAVSAALSADPGLSARRLPAILLLVAAPLVFMPFAGTPRLTRHGLTALTLGLAAGLAVMALKGPMPGSHTPRYTSFMGVMNYGGALGMLYPLLFGGLIGSLAGRERARSRVLSLALAGATVGALLNGTRIVWVSIAATTLFLLLVNLRSLTWRLAAVVLALAAVSAAFFCLNPRYGERLVSIAPEYHERLAPAGPGEPVLGDAILPGSAPAENASSNKIRLALWRDGLQRLPGLPLFGLGPGGSPDFKFDAGGNAVGRDPKPGGHYHNTFLTATVEMGFPGLAALLGLFVPSLALAARNFRSPDPARRLWSRLLLALLLAFAVHSMTDTLFNIKTTVQLFAFLLVVCWAKLREPEPLCEHRI